MENNSIVGEHGLWWSRHIDFCTENAFIISDTMFQHCTRRNYPWTSPDRKKDWLRSCSLHSRWRTSLQLSHTSWSRPSVTYLLSSHTSQESEKEIQHRYKIRLAEFIIRWIEIQKSFLSITNRILKSARRRRKHCALAARWSQKFRPGGAGWPKFNQLEMVSYLYLQTQFRVIVVTDPQTNKHTHTHKQTDKGDYNTLRRSFASTQWLSYLLKIDRLQD